MEINPKIEDSWKEILKDEFEKQYFKKLKEFLLEEKSKYTIYPTRTGSWVMFFGTSGNPCASFIRKYF
jgi:uracil-DNA glycosylase